MDCEKTKRLLEVIREIHEGGKDIVGPRWTLYEKFKQLADVGNGKAMLEYYETCLRSSKGRRVAEELARSGRKTLESEYKRFLEIYSS